VSSFPLMANVPAVLDTAGWTWECYNTPSCPSQTFWVGCDREGNRWLTKLRGSFYAYREVVFDRLAQAMGWSCQTSAFLKLDKHTARELGLESREIHGAHWFMQEHSPSPCSDSCPLAFLRDHPLNSVDDFQKSAIAHLLDLPKADFAACLFGANEPPGHLFTANHELVLIDAEQMFSTGPCELDGTAWWNLPDGRPSLSGRALAYEVCRELCSLSPSQIKDALSVPQGVNIEKRWPISPKLKASKKFAENFLRMRSGSL
jgi:hypothetical protein